MAEYASGEEKCGAPAPNGASVCALTKGHDGGHRNAWSTAEWPNDEHTPCPGGPGPCTYVYGPGGDRCAFANGGVQHNHRTETGLGYMRQDQWRQWSGVTEESVAKQLAALQRKVRAQANQINKLEELRRAAVDKSPEYQALKRHLDSQASLTMRESALRKQADQHGADLYSQVGRLATRVTELDRDRRSERERGDRFQEELRKVMNDLRTDHVDQVRRNNNRFYRLAALLTDDTAGETWDTLLQRVADLRAELEVERVRANSRKAELDKQEAARLFMGPSAYGTTPIAPRIDELAKDLDSVSRVMHVLNERLTKLDREVVQRCESRHGDQRCVSYTGHTDSHHAGPGTERW